MPKQQMTFAQIGTLYNAISNQLIGGVTPQNQQPLLQQISTVQTQLQGLINRGDFNNFTDADGANATIVHAQNIADQMSFLTKVVGTTFGGNNVASNAPPKYINDVVRDVQDIVAGDANLAALATKGNAHGFQQVSNLLTSPTPFPDSGPQTQTLLQFVSDAQSLADRGVAAIGMAPDSDTVKQLITDINTVGTNISTYSNAQGGVFAARFNNEFGGIVPGKSGGVNGTASAELIKGLQTGDAALIKGAADVMKANAMDVRSNMLAQGDTFTPAKNGGIPDVVADIHTAGMVFDDAVTKLIGGVYGETVDANGIKSPGNQASIVADLKATQAGLQNVIDQGKIPASELAHLKQIVSILGHETGLVAGIDPNTTSISQVNGQINNDTTAILNIANHDANIQKAAGGSFVPLPPEAHGVIANIEKGLNLANIPIPPAVAAAAIPPLGTLTPSILKPPVPMAGNGINANADINAHAPKALAPGDDILDINHHTNIPHFHIHDHLV